MGKIRLRNITALIIAISLLFPCLAACGNQNEKLNVTITIWHYYNDVQKSAFETLVNEFNEGLGKTKGITAITEQKGASTAEYSDYILKSAKGDVGADALPDMFLAYPDTAKAIDRLKPLADLDLYFSKTELDSYNESFIEEGRIDYGNGLKNFPIAKSTEIMMLNKTEWDAFAEDTAATLDMLKTIEGLIEVSEAYFDWSGGNAFYGRDSLANYFIIGAKQLDVDLFGVDENDDALIDTDKDVLRKLWDSYYVPYLKGYFASAARFRTDDLKNKTIVAGTGSSTSAAYTPTTTIEGNKENPAEFIIIDNPCFEGKPKYAFQQGAGLSVVDNNNANIVKGCVEFLKWFTETERNIAFSVQSGYIPVKKSSLDMAKIDSVIQQQGLTVTDAGMSGLRASIYIVNNSQTYSNKPFPEGNSARNVLSNSLNMDTLNTLRKNVINKAKNEGISEAEAIAALGYISDAAFDDWYASVRANLTALFA